jgi:bifunctional non-homologous end joining protein LigD
MRRSTTAGEFVAYKDGRRVRLLSGNDVDHARRFGDLAAAVAALADETLVLDGEVTIFDQALRSRFDLLRQSDPSIVATPRIFIAFDVLYRAGRDLSQTPLIERRLNLEDVVAGHDLVLPARRLAANGFTAWAEVLERGYEGMAGKDEASPYRGGNRRSWPKVKVPGWTRTPGGHGPLIKGPEGAPAPLTAARPRAAAT